MKIQKKILVRWRLGRLVQTIINHHFRNKGVKYQVLHEYVFLKNSQDLYQIRPKIFR